jgi:hypothetical protein
MMAVRAAILLVCLVVAPMFAIFGKGAPEVIRSLLLKYAGSPEKGGSPATAESEPPIFRPGLLASNSPQHSVISPDVESGLRGTVAGVPRDPTAIPPINGTDQRPASTPDALAQSVGRLASSGPPAVRMPAAADAQSSAMSRASEEAGDSPRIPAGAGGVSASDTLQFSGNTSFPPNYFHAAEQRLRQMGATYYVLEAIEPRTQEYRFFCKVAAGARPDQTRAFYAADRDALAAVNEVVRQVEGWRVQMQQ